MLYEKDQVNASESCLYVKRAAALLRSQISNLIDDAKMVLLGNGSM